MASKGDLLALNSGITFPNTPNLILIRRLAVVGLHGCCQSTGRPPKLSTLFGIHCFKTPYNKPPTNPSPPPMRSHTDFAWFHDVPILSTGNDRSPHVAICTFNFSKCSCEQTRVAILLLHSLNHLFETIDLGADVFTTCLRSFDIQAQLKIFFVTDEYIGETCNLLEGS